MRHLTRTHEEKCQLAAEICDYLNELVDLDRHCMNALTTDHVRCNEALSDHPTVQVQPANSGFEVGMLGIINGLIGVDDKQWGYIVAVFDDDGGLVRFATRHPVQQIPDETLDEKPDKEPK